MMLRVYPPASTTPSGLPALGPGPQAVADVHSISGLGLTISYSAKRNQHPSLGKFGNVFCAESERNPDLMFLPRLKKSRGTVIAILGDWRIQ